MPGGTASGPAPALCSGSLCRQRAATARAAHPAAPGQRLCVRCRNRLRDTLLGLPSLHGECGQLLSTARTSGAARQKISGGRPSGLPFNADAADVRSDIKGLLASWSALVADENALAPPPCTVGGLARFLVRHLRWLAAHPAAGDASAEFAEVGERARRIAGRGGVQRRIPVGVCVREGCPGELVALLDAGGGGGSPGEILCTADPGHVWPSGQWSVLQGLSRRTGTAEERSAERWLTAAEVSRLFGAPAGTVYRLASEHAWRRRRSAGRTRYAMSDAVASLGSRVRHPAGELPD
ncbi:hypothetical protein [Streptomyces sp. YIM 98790]|uniref:hypothetical protein n=1 Tax=Streptomyces sp. YIM 98790 TaxID=2689077 RepID=UPI00140BFFDA|nr:hypothetical protein [Streptomyces sp. YIM 98790]